MLRSFCLIAGLALAHPGLCLQGPERLLVVSADEGTLSILNPVSGVRVSSVRLGPGAREVAVSPDGTTAVVANYGLAHGGQTISIVDLHAARVVRSVQTRVKRKHLDGTIEKATFHRPSSVAFLPGGTEFVATVETEGKLLFVDVASGTVRDVVDLGQEDPCAVLVDPEGRRVFVSNRTSGSVSVVDLGRRRLAATVEAGGGASGMALHPTRGELWVANTQTDSISVIDLGRLEETIEFACGAGPVALAFSRDGKRVACANRSAGSLTLFATDSRKAVDDVELDRGADRAAPEPARLLLAPQGDRLYVSCPGDDSVRIVDMQSWKVMGRFEVAAGPAGLACVPGRGTALLAK